MCVISIYCSLHWNNQQGNELGKILPASNKCWIWYSISTLFQWTNYLRRVVKKWRTMDPINSMLDSLNERETIKFCKNISIRVYKDLDIKTRKLTAFILHHLTNDTKYQNLIKFTCFTSYLSVRKSHKRRASRSFHPYIDYMLYDNHQSVIVIFIQCAKEQVTTIK